MACFGECNAECFPPTDRFQCEQPLFIRPTFFKQWEAKLHERIIKDDSIGADSCLSGTQEMYAKLYQDSASNTLRMLQEQLPN